LLSVVIADNKTGGLFFNGPRRRKAASRHWCLSMAYTL